MTRKKNAKPFWEMTTAELREATKDFDKEFAFERAKPITPEMKARWDRAKSKDEPSTNGKTEQTIVIQLDKDLLKHCIALAKRKRLSRDALIACGLRVLLAAEGSKEG
jgi:hypothetical protein